MNKSPLKHNKYIPILNHGLVRDNKLVYTNADIWLEYQVNYNNKAILVDREVIAKAIAVSKNASFIDDKSIDAGGLTIAFDNTWEVDQFPLPQAIESEPVIIHGFAKAIKSIAYAAAKMDVRYYLMGVCIDVKSGLITLVACDGHRLDFKQIDQNCQIPDGQYIVPNDAVKYLDSDTVQLATGWIKCGAVTAKLVDGRYPDWRRVIPEHQFKLEIDRDQMLGAIKKLYPLTDKKFRGIKLIINDYILFVEVNDMSVSIHTISNNKPLNMVGVTIGINADYLQDAVKSCEPGNLTIEFTDSNSSIKINKARVVMPMRL